jgi:hypothetical protein
MSNGRTFIPSCLRNCSEDETHARTNTHTHTEHGDVTGHCFLVRKISAEFQTPYVTANICAFTIFGRWGGVRNETGKCSAVKVPMWAVQVPMWAVKVQIWAVKLPMWAIKVAMWAVKAPIWAVKVAMWAVKVPMWAVKVAMWAFKVAMWAVKSQC